MANAKMKTVSAAKKRFKRVGKNGKIKRGHAYRRHLMTKKTPKQRRQLRKSAFVSDADYKNISALLAH